MALTPDGQGGYVKPVKPPASAGDAKKATYKNDLSTWRRLSRTTGGQAGTPTTTTTNYADSAALGDSFDVSNGEVYVGIPHGSDLEKRLTNLGQSAQVYHNTGFKAPFGNGPYEGYKTGAEVDLLNKLDSQDPNEVLALQLRLHEIGMLDSFEPGKADKATRSAFRDLLAQSNISMKPWQATLQDLTDSGGKVDSADKIPPLTVALTNPDDIKGIANTVAKTVYGGNLPQDQLDQFVQTFHQMEQASQTAAYQKTYHPETFGTQVLPRDVSSAEAAQAFAEEEIRKRNPEQAAATQFGAAMDDILANFTQARPGGAQV